MDPIRAPEIAIANNTTEAMDAATNGILSDTLRVEQEFERALEWWSGERTRCQRNWNLYSGLELGQYTEEDKARAIQEGRDLSTFNVVTQKVDSLAGYILKNRFDADFIPVEGEDGLFTRILKQMYLSDKNMMDWDTSFANLVIAGLVMQGFEEMYVDRKFHPLGNIAFRNILPGYVVVDPRWKTASMKDCQMAWIISFLTASQIAELWPDRVNTMNFIQGDIERTKSHGEYFDGSNDNSVTPKFDVQETDTGTAYYRVIRKMEMVTEEIEVEYDDMTGTDLPIGTDYAAKLAFLEKNNPQWEPERIKKRKDRRRVCMVTTVCRQLDQNDPLEKKPSEIQVGRLPIFEWSAARINGKSRGQVDLLADIQKKINYREELITNIIETEAAGAKLVDPMLFGDDQDLKENYVRDHNQPNKTIWTAPGALQRGLQPVPIAKAQLPQDARDQLMRMWEYADRISKAPAVFDARSEKSGESGYLYAQKARVAEQQSYTLFDALKRYEQEKAEAYLEQAKLQYTISGVERRFIIKTGAKNETLSINVKTHENIGNQKIEKIDNDFANLPRHKVVISESPVSTTNRLITRAISTELLRVLPLDAIGTRQVFTSSLVESLDTFDGKDKEKLVEFREIEEEIARENLKANLLGLKKNNMLLEADLKNTQAQIAAQAGGGAPGMPPSATPPAPPMMRPVASPAPMGGIADGSKLNTGTMEVGSMEGGPVPPEKSAGYSAGGPVTGQAPAAEAAPVPMPPPEGQVPMQAPQQPQQAPPAPSPQEIVDQAAQETGGSVSISFKSKPKKE